MKKKVFLLILALLTVFNISAIGTIIYNNYFSSNSISANEDKYISTLKDSLKLSEKQCGKMKECNNCFQKNCSSLSHQLKMQRNHLIGLLKNDSTNNIKINNTLLKIDSLQSSLLREIVNNLLTQKEILSDQQRQKFFSMILSDTTINNEACCLKNNHKKQE
jgi:Spy/CpxP family protein refolding chaperone